MFPLFAFARGRIQNNKIVDNIIIFIFKSPFMIE